MTFTQFLKNKSMKNLNELPDKWEDEMYENVVEKHAIAFQSLQKLLILRDIYRDGWLPKDYRYEWKIGFMNGVAGMFHGDRMDCFLSFKDLVTTTKFLENFKDLIITAKPLMS